MIYFSTSKWNKLIKVAVESLTLKFDMESITINKFNKVFMDWYNASGWNLTLADILTIPTPEGDSKDFERLSLADIKIDCAT